MKPYYDEDGITIYHGDCREVLPKLDESFDAVITDPPYGIPEGSAFVRKGGAVIGRGDGRFNATPTPYSWVTLAAPMVVDGGHVAFFIDRATSRQAEYACEIAGLQPWQKFYLVKETPAPTPRPTFASAVEECLIAEKRAEARRWYGGGYVPNRWIGRTPNAAGSGCGHESQKPIEPMISLVKSLVPSGGKVLEPFLGTGTTLVAAKLCGCGGVGIEQDERWCEIAANRLRQGVLFGRGVACGE